LQELANIGRNTSTHQTIGEEKVIHRECCKKKKKAVYPCNEMKKGKPGVDYGRSAFTGGPPHEN